MFPLPSSLFPLRSSPGFTRTELLVALGLLTVIFGLLIPLFGSQKEKARRSICANNLRQIGTAIRAYAADHSNRIPSAVSNAGGLTWDAALVSNQYLSVFHFHCPADTYPRKSTQRPRTYAISCGDSYTNGLRAQWIQGSRLDCQHFADPSRIVLVTERPAHPNGQGYGAAERQDNWCDRTLCFSAHAKQLKLWVPAQYKRQMNYLFLDGHVEWAESLSSNCFPAPPPVKTAGQVVCP